MAEPQDKPSPGRRLSTDRARAGATPHVTRYVLAISMVLIVIVFGALFWAGGR